MVCDDRYRDLVRVTVHHAVKRSPYYRRTLGGLTLDGWSDFTTLPVINRDILTRHQAELRVPGLDVHHICTSSGTTGDLGTPPLILYRSEGEKAAADELYQHSFDSIADSNHLILSLIDGTNGHDLAGGVPGLLNAPLTEPHHLRVIASVLADHFVGETVTRTVDVVAASGYLLKLLTLGLSKLNVRPDEFNVKIVVSKGELLTNRWRRLLGAIWNAHVGDVYGASEVPGFNCTHCLRCGGFKAASTVYSEFLELDNDRRVEAGVARLIVTPFYPLAEITPLIRYDTGDIVFRDPSRPPACRTCFILLGRQREVLRTCSGEACVSALRIADLLDNFHGVRRREEQPAAGHLGVRADVGLPKFTLQAEVSPEGQTTIKILQQVVDPIRFLAQVRMRGLIEKLSSAVFPIKMRENVSFEVYAC